MKKEKLYFENEHSESCTELSDHLLNAKYSGLKEIELLEAIPDSDTKGLVWCMELTMAVSRHECRKSYCSYYDPLNGKNGICSFRGKLYRKGAMVKFDVL